MSWCGPGRPRRASPRGGPAPPAARARPGCPPPRRRRRRGRPPARPSAAPRRSVRLPRSRLAVEVVRGVARRLVRVKLRRALPQQLVVADGRGEGDRVALVVALACTLGLAVELLEPLVRGQLR